MKLTNKAPHFHFGVKNEKNQIFGEKKFKYSILIFGRQLKLAHTSMS